MNRGVMLHICYASIGDTPALVALPGSERGDPGDDVIEAPPHPLGKVRVGGQHHVRDP